jgi:glycosyltransferase involved in cell wall biosynthesis
MGSIESKSKAVPAILPVPDGADRPFWSVMIPAYNCDELFEQTLRCVLDQDPGVDRMQITVVDDCSPNGRSREIVSRLAPGRVEYFEQPSNVGLAGNWNTCIERSRGRWVHILHQDDLILPGFYERLGRSSVERPEAGAAFCRQKIIDGRGDLARLSELEQEQAGLIEGWIDKITLDQRITCPSIVVKRSVYEEIGGFRSDLLYCLDWEMWVRIAFRYPYWYEPEALACWREHATSETRRLAKLNILGPDLIRGLDIMLAEAPEQKRGLILRAIRLKRWCWYDKASRQMDLGEIGKAFSTIFYAYRHVNPIEQARTYQRFLRRALKIWFFRHLLGEKPTVTDA